MDKAERSCVDEWISWMISHNFWHFKALNINNEIVVRGWEVARKCSCVFFAGVKLNSVSVQRTRMESFNCGSFRGAKYAEISLCMLSRPWLVVYNPHFSAQWDASDALSRKTESCVQSCATCTKLKTPKWASLTTTAFSFHVWSLKGMLGWLMAFHCPFIFCLIWLDSTSHKAEGEVIFSAN